MSDIIAIDFETHLINEQTPWPKPVCLSWADGIDYGLLIGNSMESYLKQLLESDCIILAHNVAFELNVIWEYFPELRDLLLSSLDASRWICTQLYQQRLNNLLQNKDKLKTSLADLAAYYLKVDLSDVKTDPDAWRLRYSELDGIPLSEWPNAAVSYAINDSIYTRQIYLKQIKIRKFDLHDDVYCYFILNNIGTSGMEIAQDRVKTLEEEILAIINPIYKFLEEQGFVTYNIKTKKYSKAMKKLESYIQDTIPDPIITVKGNIKKDAEALAQYLGQVPDDPILPKFQILSHYEKALSAYVARMKQANPLIRTNYDVVKSTNRTSSKTSKLYPSINIQQITRAL